MRTEDLFSGAVPMVVKLDIGMTEPEGVALEITYAQTRERFEARQFDRAMYVMTIPMANEFLRLLETDNDWKGRSAKLKVLSVRENLKFRLHIGTNCLPSGSDAKAAQTGASVFLLRRHN